MTIEMTSKMMSNEIILLVLVGLLIIYYKSAESFENTQSCSDEQINKNIYMYNVNNINRGNRPL